MPKRSLMLAGGGVKIAFQAGVLQVWLDEAGISFDHADAVSAACFNLAMWTQGMSGRRIADNWRHLDPIAGVDVHWSQLAKLIYAESLFELDAYRHKIFPAWGLDWDRIRSSRREATFNVYNFSRHELRPVTPPEMTEDHLVAAASLPMWFPPVRIAGETYIDAVFNTASNLEEAIRRGADELWIIWTTSQRGEWFDGFVGNFFGIFEATTVGGYKRVLARIERNNAAIAEGQPGEFGRPIAVRELKAEVPVHYLLNFSRDRAAEAVNRGVEAARAWCDAQGIPYQRGADVDSGPARPASVRFTEEVHGDLGIGPLTAELAVRIADVDQFLASPAHAASIAGAILCARFGGRRPIVNGTLNLFVDRGDPTRKRVLYRAVFEDADGNPLTLSGAQELHDERANDARMGTREVAARIYRGLVAAEQEDGAEVIASGVLRAGPAALLMQLTTFRAEGPTLAERTSALTRFGAFYFGRLWDVYARKILSSAPF